MVRWAEQRQILHASRYPWTPPIPRCAPSGSSYTHEPHIGVGDGQRQSPDGRGERRERRRVRGALRPILRSGVPSRDIGLWRRQLRSGCRARSVRVNLEKPRELPPTKRHRCGMAAGCGPLPRDRSRAADGIAAARRASESHLADRPAAHDLCEQALSHEKANLLRGLLNQLPDVQREVITLAFYGQLTHTEIAEHLDLSTGTVKGRMRLGLHKLRANIDRADP